MLALVVAERVTGGDADRRGAYVLAVLVGAAGATAVDLFALARIWHRFEFALDEPAVDPATGFLIYRAGHAIYLFVEWLTLGGLATFALLGWRQARSEAAYLHQQQLEYTDAARRVLESRLLAMQARVDPNFLLATLEQVRRLQLAAPGRARKLLDELIVYLRVAMPRMRDSVSTLGREIALARAFLDVARSRGDNGIMVEVDAPPAELSGARMPPMLILPLLDYAMARLGTIEEGRGTVRLRCRAADGRLRLDIIAEGTRPGSSGAGDEHIARVRDRLTVLYGAACSIETRSTTASTAVVVAIPLEAGSQPPTPRALVSSGEEVEQ
jgi:hypothetical protein